MHLPANKSQKQSYNRKTMQRHRHIFSGYKPIISEKILGKHNHNHHHNHLASAHLGLRPGEPAIRPPECLSFRAASCPRKSRKKRRLPAPPAASAHVTRQNARGHGTWSAPPPVNRNSAYLASPVHVGSWPANAAPTGNADSAFIAPSICGNLCLKFLLQVLQP